MRINSFILCAAASMFATASFAQSTGGSMSGNSMSGGNAMTMQSGTSIFSRQDMAMMIVDRDKSTMGMTDDQKKAARKEEMTKDRAETPDQRMARKQRYDCGMGQAHAGGSIRRAWTNWTRRRKRAPPRCRRSPRNNTCTEYIGLEQGRRDCAAFFFWGNP